MADNSITETPFLLTDVKQAFAYTFVREAYYNYWQAHYAAYRAGQEIENRSLPFLSDNKQVASVNDREEIASTPSTVRDAYDYYLHQCDGWGSPHLWRIDSPSIEGLPWYLVVVTTDGDDGWVEAYDNAGILLAAGRTYIELIHWGEREAIRANTDDSEFPEELADRFKRTLWQP